MEGLQVFNLATLELMGLRVVYFSFAVLAAWAVLRALDVLGGIAFADTYRKIARDPMALAVYHGCRLLAVAWIGSRVV